jgi:hypothetical protein
MKILSNTKEEVVFETTIVETDEGNVVVKDIVNKDGKITMRDMMFESSGKYITNDEEYYQLWEEIEEYLFNKSKS